eukprot:2285916-Amphidinium_carterae.1
MSYVSEPKESGRPRLARNGPECVSGIQGATVAIAPELLSLFSRLSALPQGVDTAQKRLIDARVPAVLSCTDHY